MFRYRGNRVGEYLWEKEMERLEQTQKHHPEPMSRGQAAGELAVLTLAGAAVCMGIIMLLALF